jgi:hypothetical protein
MLPHEKPAYEFGSIEAFSFTSRFELSAGINDWRYQNRQMQLQDVLIQPKVLIYQSFGKEPSLSASAGLLMPVSGNTQHWDNYAMAQVSWFLFRPQEPKHPYDHWLTIHLNLGTKARYDPVRLSMRRNRIGRQGLKSAPLLKTSVIFRKRLMANIMNMKKSFRHLATDSGITTPVGIFRPISLAYRADRLWGAWPAVGAYI